MIKETGRTTGALPSRVASSWAFTQPSMPRAARVAAIGRKVRSYATVENRKSKGIESYMGGKTLCLSHFGYTS
jgi:hypothetical protein